MFVINNMSQKPIYEQLVEQAEKFILTGIIKSGDSLPSVRNLSVNLSVNPNTIQKAYTDLANRGIVFSVPGKGCFVSAGALDIIKSAKRNQISVLKENIKQLKLIGIEKREIIELTEKIYKGESSDD